MASADEQVRVETRTGVKFSDAPAPPPPGTIRLDTLKEIAPDTAAIAEQIAPAKPPPWWMAPVEHPGIGIALCIAVLSAIAWRILRNRQRDARTDQATPARVVRLRP